jgi:hypothetical protein
MTMEEGGRRAGLERGIQRRGRGRGHEGEHGHGDVAMEPVGHVSAKREVGGKEWDGRRCCRGSGEVGSGLIGANEVMIFMRP